VVETIERDIKNLEWFGMEGWIEEQTAYWDGSLVEYGNDCRVTVGRKIS
jgi:hypothetical protein